STAFHFYTIIATDTFTLDSALSLEFDNVVEVDIQNANDTAAIAIALRNAINAQNGLLATYTSIGEHRIEVTTDGLGYVDDVLLARLWSITSNIGQQGTYLPADSKVEFRLATKDPLGNCTNGIVRVYTDKTNDANNTAKAKSYWNAYSYLNVWVVNNIGGDLQGGGTILGYAQFPASGLLSTDGIVVIASYVDENDKGGRTATHEVGHWLGLRHIWGDAQCGSDNVLDTPTAFGPNFGICGNHPTNDPNSGGGAQYHSIPYNVGGTCGTSQDGEMFNNYMDYSDDACMNMFTLGQKAIMDYTFHGDGNDPGVRSYMISDENLELTGVADPYTPSDCAPISAFFFNQSSGDFATQKMICEGEDVRFEEAAYNYNSNTVDFSWTFEGGTPSISDDDNPQIDYANPGVYDVTLQVTNDQGSDTQIEENMVVVSSLNADNQSDWGYVDSYWSEQVFLDGYFVFNRDNTDNKWEWYFGADGGSTGWESVRMFNMNNVAGEVDELISPSYNLSTLDNPALSFRYSGAALDNTPNDELKILASKNCGESWTPVATFSDFELANSGLVSDSYRPNTNSTWTDVNESLSSSIRNSSNVRFKFRWKSGGRGNNFYIDDFTISGSPLGIADLEDRIDLNIAPNPTSNQTTVTMSLKDAANVQLDIVDLIGRDVRNIFAKEMSNGTHSFDVDLSSYPSGVYFLRISVDENMLMKKVVKN
ncbi:MAG: T9SS type A sorting domain-containing protein, partial [Flavobacteriales bacterium]|nr:T9SS type A sorting domain-containing protein [Flavobacteriales bacterium]